MEDVGLPAFQKEKENFLKNAKFNNWLQILSPVSAYAHPGGNR